MDDDTRTLGMLVTSFIGCAIVFGYIAYYLMGVTVTSILMTLITAFFCAVKLTTASLDQQDKEE